MSPLAAAEPVLVLITSCACVRACVTIAVCVCAYLFVNVNCDGKERCCPHCVGYSTVYRIECFFLFPLIILDQLAHNHTGHIQQWDCKFMQRFIVFRACAICKRRVRELQQPPGTDRPTDRRSRRHRHYGLVVYARCVFDTYFASLFSLPPPFRCLFWPSGSVWNGGDALFLSLALGCVCVHPSVVPSGVNGGCVLCVRWLLANRWAYETQEASGEERARIHVYTEAQHTYRAAQGHGGGGVGGVRTRLDCGDGIEIY